MTGHEVRGPLFDPRAPSWINDEVLADALPVGVYPPMVERRRPHFRLHYQRWPAAFGTGPMDAWSIEHADGYIGPPYKTAREACEGARR